MKAAMSFDEIHTTLGELMASLPDGQPMITDSDMLAIQPPGYKVWGAKALERASALLACVRTHLARSDDRRAGTYYTRVDKLLEKHLAHTMSRMEIPDEVLQEKDAGFAEEMEAYTAFAVGFLRLLVELAAEMPEVRLLDQRSNSLPERNLPTISPREAAAIYGASLKTFQNVVSDRKRTTRKEFEWVLRGGRKKRFSVDREKFMAWLKSSPKRKGRNPNPPLSLV